MLRKISIKKEEKALYQAFENCFDEVKGDAFLESYAQEKIHHSMQVVGAGNYILKNEKKFQHKSDEYLRLAKLVCLFHDIGRFKEIKLLKQDRHLKCDHGYFSYEILKEMGYSDLRLLLPIKQHGNLADALEKDEEYQKISDVALKKEVQELYFFVKDADKIANFHILKYENRMLNNLFFGNIPQEQKGAPISAEVLNCMENRSLVAWKDVHTFCDRLLMITCLVYEIYYKPSFDFIAHRGLLDYMLSVLREYNKNVVQQAYIENKIKQDVAEIVQNL